ncbi:hypothetical protein [Microbacterium sp.]
MSIQEIEIVIGAAGTGRAANGERADVLIGAHPKPVYTAKIEELLA